MSVLKNNNQIDETEEKFDKSLNDINLVKVDEELEVKEEPEKKEKKSIKDKLIKERPINKEGFLITNGELRKRKYILYASIGIVALIVIILSIMLCYNIFYNKIFSNIYISQIDISNLTKEEAISKINNELTEVLNKEISLKCSDKEYAFALSEVGVKYDVEKAVEEAYQIGRSGNIFGNNIKMIQTFFTQTNEDLDFSYEEEKFEELVNNINSQFSSLVQSSYEVVEDKLIIKKGATGTEIKSDVLKEKIINNIKELKFEPIEVGVIVREPNAINIDEIHNEIYKEPVDAYYTKDPFEVHESQNGVDFAISIDEAKALLEQEQEEYEIGLKVLYPNVTTAQIGTEAFPDLLSTCTTSYIVSKVGRTNNLKLASSKIDGYVLMPGDTFSYNKVVGERTIEAGFQMAGVYSGGKEVEGLGGGICQISSTLYNIVVKSNLEIVQRENHVFLPGYLPAGQDATVVWGAIDFKFKNTRKYPVKIVSSVGGGYVTMKLYGMKEENEPEISFETVYHQTLYPQTVYEDTASLPEGQTKVETSGKNGCKSTTYKVVKQNGQVVSRTVLSNDTYKAMNKIVLRGTKKTAVQQPVAEAKPVEQQPAEQKPAEQKPAEQKPAEQKPTEQKPAESTSGSSTSTSNSTNKPSGNTTETPANKPAGNTTTNN